MIDAPVVSIHIPPPLRAFSGGNDEVTASGDTVAEALHALEHSFPGLAGRILRSNGQLLPSVDVYLGAISIRQLDGPATPIGAEERISIVPRTEHESAGEISVG